MTVRFGVDDEQMQRRFDDLDNLTPLVTAMERTLALQYQAGQAAVHVITGSLKHSEKIGSAMTAGRWEGEISFGGASPGFPNDPVVYAAYEAARGAPHDYTTAITRLTGRYRDAIREHLGGRR